MQKYELVYSTIRAKFLALISMKEDMKKKRPRTPKGTYVKCFGKLIKIG